MNEPQQPNQVTWTTRIITEDGWSTPCHEIVVGGEVVATYPDVTAAAEHIVELMAEIERLRELIANVASHPEHMPCGCAVCQELADEVDRILSGGE